MKVNGETKEAIFLRRVKRFSALVNIGGEEEIAYLPNTGRVWDLLAPGQRVFVVRKLGLQRKTRWDLYLFPVGRSLVWANPQAANSLVFKALKGDFFPQFREFQSAKREVAFGELRFDFLLTNNEQKYLLAVKSVTLVQEGRALFPDAPTQRGTRQIKALMEALKEHYRAGVIFIIQREDVRLFSPNEKIDPLFSHALEEAAEIGVGIYAYNSKVEIDEISLGKELRISFDDLKN